MLIEQIERVAEAEVVTWGFYILKCTILLIQKVVPELTNWNQALQTSVQVAVQTVVPEAYYTNYSALLIITLRYGLSLGIVKISSLKWRLLSFILFFGAYLEIKLWKVFGLIYDNGGATTVDVQEEFPYVSRKEIVVFISLQVKLVIIKHQFLLKITILYWSWCLNMLNIILHKFKPFIHPILVNQEDNSLVITSRFLFLKLLKCIILIELSHLKI